MIDNSTASTLLIICEAMRVNIAVPVTLDGMIRWGELGLALIPVLIVLWRFSCSVPCNGEEFGF